MFLKILFVKLRKFPFIPVFWEFFFFNHEMSVKFCQMFFCIDWYNDILFCFVFYSVNMMDCIDWFMNAEAVLYSLK